MPELAPGIDRHPEKQGGEPCVAGTRVPVRRIGDLREEDGAAPEGIADRFDISLADVHRALAYYYDHPDEMDRYERRERKQEQTADDAEPFEHARDRLRRGR